MGEKLDIYNSEKIKTGKIIERKGGVKLEKGEYILAVQCWIINGKGEINNCRNYILKISLKYSSFIINHDKIFL